MTEYCTRLSPPKSCHRKTFELSLVTNSSSSRFSHVLDRLLILNGIMLLGVVHLAERFLAEENGMLHCAESVPWTPKKITRLSHNPQRRHPSNGGLFWGLKNKKPEKKEICMSFSEKENFSCYW